MEGEINEIVSLVKGMRLLEVNYEHFKDLIQEHKVELLTSELKKSEIIQHSEIQEVFIEEIKIKKKTVK